MQPEKYKLTTWVVHVLIGLFVLTLLFDAVDDVFLGNKYEGVPTALSGLIAAIVTGLLGHDFFRKNGKKPKE